MNEVTQEFLTSVKDDNEILNKLLAAGYFEQKVDQTEIKGIYSYKNILIASFATSLLLSIVMSPLDLVVFNV